MKEYKTEIAIIIGAIIIALSLFVSLTHDKRKAFNFCMEEIGKGAIDQIIDSKINSKEFECMTRTYNIDRRNWEIRR